MLAQVQHNITSELGVDLSKVWSQIKTNKEEKEDEIKPGDGSNSLIISFVKTLTTALAVFVLYGTVHIFHPVPIYLLV